MGLLLEIKSGPSVGKRIKLANGQPFSSAAPDRPPSWPLVTFPCTGSCGHAPHVRSPWAGSGCAGVPRSANSLLGCSPRRSSVPCAGPCITREIYRHETRSSCPCSAAGMVTHGRASQNQCRSLHEQENHTRERAVIIPKVNLPPRLRTTGLSQ